MKYIKFLTSHKHHLLKKIALTSSSVQITTDFSQLQQGINYRSPPTHAPQGSINILLSGAFAQVGNLLNLRRRSSILPEASKGLSFLFCSPRIPDSFAVMYLPDVHSVSSNSKYLSSMTHRRNSALWTLEKKRKLTTSTLVCPTENELT